MQLARQGHRQRAGSGVRFVSAVVQQRQYGARHHRLPPKRAETEADSVGFVFHRNGDNNRFLVELRPLLLESTNPAVTSHGSDEPWVESIEV
jgi:hypothetical protein